jgi:hypothetical protein
MDHETKVRRPFRKAPPAEIERRARVFASSLEDDLMATLAGVEITAACGGGKKVAIAGGVDDRNGRRWASGERSNPLYRIRGVIEKAADPWRVVSWVAALAARAVLVKEGPLPEWRWRQLYVEAFHVEQPADGQEDVTSQLVLVGQASVADQYQADARCVSALLRRLALGLIGQQRGYTLAGPRPH